MVKLSSSTTVPIEGFTPSAAALGGLAVTVADGVKPSIGTVVLDDNFTIPVAASVAIRVSVAYLPATPTLV
jgi:dolichol kinase